jgi:hypothetical protein
MKCGCICHSQYVATDIKCWCECRYKEIKVEDSESKAIWIALEKMRNNLLELDKFHSDKIAVLQATIKEFISRANIQDESNHGEHQWFRRERDLVLERIKKIEDSSKRFVDYLESPGTISLFEQQIFDRLSKLEATHKEGDCSIDYWRDANEDLKRLETSHVGYVNFMNKWTESYSKDKINHIKWQRDVEEKCLRVMDKNKELQIEVDALKQMIWILREKMHELPSRIRE